MARGVVFVRRRENNEAIFRGKRRNKNNRVSSRTCESRGTNGARMFAREGLLDATLRGEMLDKRRWPVGFKCVGTHLAADAKKHNAVEIGG